MGTTEEAISVQEQINEFGFNHHFPVFVDVSLGALSASLRRGEAACPTGPPGLPSLLRINHRSPAP